MNETLVYSENSSDEMCVELLVFEDGLVETDETLLMELTTNDPAVLLVEPITALVTIVNTDSKLMHILDLLCCENISFCASSC